MNDNLTIFKNFFDVRKGQFVIINHKVERFVGLGDDGEDYYYLTYDGREITWNSCVGHIIPLRGAIKKEEYNYLKHISKLNDYDQVDKVSFLKAFNTYVGGLSEEHKFIKNFCWDLN